MKSLSQVTRILVACGALVFRDGFPLDLDGPTYTWEEIREKEVAGVRLSMTPEAALRALDALGYAVHHERQESAYLSRSSEGRRETIWLQFETLAGKRSISYFMHMRDIPAKSLEDVALWREELIRLLGGAPTRWNQWSTSGVFGSSSPKLIADSFSYSPDRDGAVRELARECLYSWECKVIEDDFDCRPPVRALSAGVISGGFYPGGLHITVTNHGLLARKLLENRAFRERDLRDLTCSRPRVH